jgi:Bifunctional DNA primase/polymerase, N-terminal
MMLTAGGSRRQRTRDRMATAVRGYAALGWACVRGVRAPVSADRSCSCDRLGCPDPAAHPVSATWARQATTDVEVLNRWWSQDPTANIILPTGRVFDVIDVPAGVGTPALARIVRDGGQVGPIAAFGADRHLFFTATRGAPDDEDEWWSCQLDCSPETIAETPGMRWHCRESYVVAPPSVLPYGREVGWIRPPDGSPLPDPLRLLEVLADTYGL